MGFSERHIAQPMVFNFDVRAIWRSGLSARSPYRQNFGNSALKG